MCPSYRATRDEQHSTRGRSRLLFEMVRGTHRSTPGGAQQRCMTHSICALPAKDAKTTTHGVAATAEPAAPNHTFAKNRGRSRLAAPRRAPRVWAGAAAIPAARRSDIQCPGRRNRGKVAESRLGECHVHRILQGKEVVARADHVQRQRVRSSCASAKDCARMSIGACAEIPRFIGGMLGMGCVTAIIATEEATCCQTTNGGSLARSSSTSSKSRADLSSAWRFALCASQWRSWH